MPGSPAFIVTADDFGYTSPINHAVATAFREGLITHASLMANMPDAAEAVELAHSLGVSDQIGCHLNLAEGRPLTEAIRHSPTFCVDGEFLEPLARPRFRPLTSSDARALAEEIRAQIAALRRAGLASTHIDSHRYVHAAPNICRVVVAVARETGVTRVRPWVNCGPTSFGARGLAKSLLNAWLASSGLKRVGYLGSIDELRSVSSSPASYLRSAEVMTHPKPGASGVVFDGDAGPLGARLAELAAAIGRDIVASPPALRYDK